MSEIELASVTAPTGALRELIGELDATLAADYAPDQRHGLSLDALFAPHVRFFVAHVDGRAAGCGGVALFAGFAEVKRMYVRPSFRGTGIAQALLGRIEAETIAAGLDVLRLETGIHAHAAIRMYERAGFRPCPVFGAYATMAPAAIATSVFLEKRLSNSATATRAASRAGNLAAPAGVHAGMTTVLITGANRGIGFALTSRYAARPQTEVLAITRSLAASDELRDLAERSNGRVRAIEADVADAAAIERLVRDVGSTPIDLLINNAGVPGWTDFGEISASDLSAVFTVNAFAPLLLAQALRANLRRGGKVVNVTSVLGSIERGRGDGGYLVYAMSKAALNMLSVKLASTLRPQGVAVLAIHPGWVQTRMGGSGAAIDVDTAADGMVRVIDALDLASSGNYRAYDCSPIPW